MSSAHVLKTSSWPTNVSWDSTFPTTLWQLPCWSNNKWALFPINRSKVVLWNCLTPKSRKSPSKMPAVEPCFIKLHDNVSKTGLRHRLFPRIFPVLEEPFCRVHASISSWPFDVFLVFSKSRLDFATHKSRKVQLLRDVPEKGFIGNVFFRRATWLQPTTLL